jgi:YTH domain-containing family protein
LLPQPIPSKDEKAIVPPISVDSRAIDVPSEVQAQAGASNISENHKTAYPHNFYASQRQPFYYQGHRVFSVVGA